ncbi:efflux RND transporter periplasmic adaptor subunit [bacterium]|nr:efflux RND transporter periplasmic adaptor subunit [bacterium]
MKISDVLTHFSRRAPFPALFWVLLVVSFTGGFLLRGGCSRGDAPAAGVHVHGEQPADGTIWTCSMHPQIKLPEPGKCPICFMDLIPLSVDQASGPAAELHLSPAAEALAGIVTAPVRKGPAWKRVRLSGKVVPDETRFRIITAWTGGRIERLVAAETGISIREGDALFELFSPDLYSAQEEYLQALRRRDTGASGSAEMLVRASAERLVQLGMTRKQIAAVETRGTPTDRVTIFSPLSGIVIHKNAFEGLYVRQGDPVYTLADLSVVWVSLDAYERDIPWLKEGDRVEFSAAALPGIPRTATITFISPVVDEKTRTASVRVVADNSEGLLKPGMFVSAEALAEVSSGGELLLVPAPAVLRTGDRAVVYVRTEREGEPVFSGREVVVGVRADSVYTVLSGLHEGEQVVVRGNFVIDSAMQIEAKPSMMNPPEKRSGTDGTGSARQPLSEKRASPASFLGSTEPVYASYLKMQKALVGTALQDARAAAGSLREAVVHVRSEGLAAEDAAAWNEIQGKVLGHTQRADNWPDIAAAREAFRSISDAVITMEERFGHGGTKDLYKAFCPMAFDNSGAFWIQDSTAVSNPYYGSMMLRCGEIRNTYEGTGR